MSIWIIKIIDIVKILVTYVILAVVLSGNPDAPSLLLAHFYKGVRGRKDFSLQSKFPKHATYGCLSVTFT
jgi:hypothetical protein